jgi:ubiquinone/menaquinone biosynthesis C-methylase UbiE
MRKRWSVEESLAPAGKEWRHPTMPRAALDYSKLAAIYDDYCVFAGDIAFFRSFAKAASGPILELMAGTGRISMPLIQDGARLVCVDNSFAMLAVLRRKLRELGLRAQVVCADVCRLPFQGSFPLVLLPFQGFTELATADDQLAALREVAGVLPVSGRFVCTSHNPVARLRSVDGTWHDIGTFSRPDGGTLRISLRTHYDEAARNVVGQQRILTITVSGEQEEFFLSLRFSLISLPELTALAEQCGLHVVGLQGDYAGGPFDEASSPAIIVIFEKTVTRALSPSY